MAKSPRSARRNKRVAEPIPEFTSESHLGLSNAAASGSAALLLERSEDTPRTRRSARRANQRAELDDARSRQKRLETTWPFATTGQDPREQSYAKNVKAKNSGQESLMQAIDENALVLALGPAGTGKTYLAIAKAVEALESGSVGRIVLSRPAVEAGESLGYLPGAMEDKLAPFLRPLYDALAERLSPKRLKTMMAEGLIEIAPVGFMRGRTLNNAFIVIDEAQNCTFGQLKMLLTRLGWHSTMVVTGDPAQTDLLPDVSGLASAADKLAGVPGIGVVRLSERDIVRHPLVAKMLKVL